MHARIAISLLTLVVLFGAMPGEAQAPATCTNLVVQGGFEAGGAVGWATVPGPGLMTGSPEFQSAAGPAIEGQRYLEVASTGPTWVRQQVQTRPGAECLLGFAYRARSGYDSAVDVYWNADRVASLLRPDDSSTDWRYFETTVQASGGDRLDLRDLSRPDAGGALIDDVYLCCSTGLAAACCCGANEIFVDTGWPQLNWVLRPSGFLARVWWDQGAHEESIVFDYDGGRPVAGTLRQDPFGAGAVLVTDKGTIFRSVEKDGRWTMELVDNPMMQRIGGAKPCTLTTTEGKFGGIWAVAGEYISRIWLDNGQWRHAEVRIGGHADSIVPPSIHGIVDGRIVGTLENGQRWNIWFEGGEPGKMRFDYSSGGPVAVSTIKCGPR